MKPTYTEASISYVEFPAPNAAALKANKAFYQSVLGWKFQDWADDYADTSSSGVMSGLNSDPTHQTRAPLAVIYTADLEQLRGRIVQAGGHITREIFSFPGGRRFHYVDPAGNELGAWSEQEAPAAR